MTLPRTASTARQVVLAYLRDHGPSTLAQIREDSGIGTSTLSAAVRSMLRGTAVSPRVLYVQRWVDTHEGERRYPRQVLALGNGNDAKRPPRDVNAAARRWRANKLARKRNNFVFNLGAKIELYDNRRKP